MIDLRNWDSSFFSVKRIGDTGKLPQFFSDKVISLEIKEEMGRLLSGSITFNDTEFHEISFALGVGKQIEISWGYADVDKSKEYLSNRRTYPDAIFTPGLAIRKMRARVTAPSGGGESDGKVTYSCGFYATDQGGEQSTRRIDNRGQTKAQAVSQMLTEIGVSTMYVNFRRGSEPAWGNNAIMQNGFSNFRLLSQLALEWRCMFRLGYSQDGLNRSIALFSDYDADSSIESYVYETTGGRGKYAPFEYKIGAGNVKSYNWQYSAGDNGSGDNVRIVMSPSGQPQFYRTIATTEGVTVYKLNADKIRSEFRNVPLQQGYQRMQEMLAITDMATLVQRGYFVATTETTAPQGIGLSMNLECIGSPLNTVPARAKFGVGFPDIFRTALRFYQTSVNHRIDRNGYTNQITIADAFPSSGGSLVG